MSRRSNSPAGGHVVHWVILILVLAFLLIPLISMALYTVRRPLAVNDQWTLDYWRLLFSSGDQSGLDLAPLWDGVVASLIAAVLTVAIMLIILVPTMVTTRLYSKKLAKVVEFLAVLPLAIPAIALVVGLGPIYRFLSTTLFSTASYWLAFAYVILVLPYSYRAIDAGMRQLDVRTLFEAAQTFGTSWLGTVVKVIIPNLRSALLSACFVSVAVVLGEYTIAALLGRDNLQTALFILNQSNSFVAAAMALLAMLFAVVLLIGMDLISAATDRTRKRGQS